MDAKTISAAKTAATKYKVPLANLLAVIEVESNGVIYASVDGKDEPLIRWEGHYFDKRLNGDAKVLARKKGLAAPKAGAVSNPNSQQRRWDNLLKPAMDINKNAAIESVSWGVGQVMGAHWEVLGYATQDALYKAARSGVGGQVDLMMRYVKEFDLIDEMQRGDFAGFARGYNGPSYKKYQYDTKMKAAAQRYVNVSTKEDTVDGVAVASVKRAENAETMLRMGSSGAKVRELQALLTRAGFPVKVDGDFGPSTKEAVKAYQKAVDLEVDGIVGPLTWNGLENYKVDPTEEPGVPGPAEAVSQTVEGRQGAAIVGGGVGLTTIANSAAEKLEPFLGTTAFIDNIYTAITALGVALTIGGVAWVAFGWWRANRTRGVKGA